MELVRVAYTSRARASENALPVIVDILATSQRNNARDGITGALVASEGRYFQIVEGPPAAIDRLLARVEMDGRHTDVRILVHDRVNERQFGEWSMTVPKVAPHLADRLTAAIAAADVEPYSAIALVRAIVAGLV